MPTYEYVCDACEHQFEEFQSFKDEPLTKCPQCKKKKLRRLFGTGAAVLFRGSGFYETDYRSDSYKNAAESDKSQQSAGKTDNSSTTSKTEGASPAPEAGKAKKSPKSGG